MRNAFAEEITKLADAEPRVVLLSGDIGNRLFDRFKERHPNRFINCGVAEANMIGMAAGLAMSGLRPVVYTIAPFIVTRCLEQIRVDICCHDVGVVLVGVGAGLAYASLGPTHHSCEDVALLRALPHMTVLAPGDPVEARLALRAAIQLNRPAYLRLGKKGEPVVHKKAPEFVIGKAITVREGCDVCLLSTGTMLPEVLGAAERLEKTGVSAQVASFHTIKPLDTTFLRGAFKSFPLTATVEEHGLIGGLGAAVAEWLADRPVRRGRLCRFGTADVFHHEAGDQEYARQRFGLTADQIAGRILLRLRLARRTRA
jgi:transketolase